MYWTERQIQVGDWSPELHVYFEGFKMQKVHSTGSITSRLFLYKSTYSLIFVHFRIMQTKYSMECQMSYLISFSFPVQPTRRSRTLCAQRTWRWPFLCCGCTLHFVRLQDISGQPSSWIYYRPSLYWFGNLVSLCHWWSLSLVLQRSS